MPVHDEVIESWRKSPCIDILWGIDIIPSNIHTGCCSSLRNKSTNINGLRNKVSPICAKPIKAWVSGIIPVSGELDSIWQDSIWQDSIWAIISTAAHFVLLNCRIWCKGKRLECVYLTFDQFIRSLADCSPEIIVSGKKFISSFGIHSNESTKVRDNIILSCFISCWKYWSGRFCISSILILCVALMVAVAGETPPNNKRTASPIYKDEIGSVEKPCSLVAFPAPIRRKERDNTLLWRIGDGQMETKYQSLSSPITLLHFYSPMYDFAPGTRHDQAKVGCGWRHWAFAWAHLDIANPP